MQRFILSTLALCVLIMSVGMATAATQAPATLKLGPPKPMKATKTEVCFPHARHDKAGVDCSTCHHTWDGKSDVKSCASAGCHDQPGKKGETAFYTAFHTKKSDRSCLGCHKKMKKAGKTVPVSCKQCHPK